MELYELSFGKIIIISDDIAEVIIDEDIEFNLKMVDEYHEFLRSCPEFERMLVRSGIIVLKYWFSVSDEEQEKRFKSRITNPLKRWKFSPMDLE